MNNISCNQLNNIDLIVANKNNSSAKFKVAGYLRLSTDDGDKEVSNSIVSQKEIILNKLKELGNDFELVDFYIDDGYTGLNTNRPSFQRLIKDVEDSKINTIITKDLSRLARNSIDANYYIEIFFLEKNIRYISILDNYDSFKADSNNEILPFKTLINDWYSKDISRKSKAGIWARKQKGLYVAARAPYGYNKSQNNKNQLVKNEEQAKIVKEIFEMYASGQSQSQIAKSLKERKILVPSCYDDNGIIKKYNYNWDLKLSRILTNRMYLGHTEYGKRLHSSYKSQKEKIIPKNEWKIAEHTHEPIIEQELFDKVQRRLNLNARTRKRKFFWLLNGLVYCKECGSQMVLKVEYREDRRNKV